MTTFIGNKQLQKAKVPEMNRFHRKQKKGTIDVWWLFDDGGLYTFVEIYLTDVTIYAMLVDVPFV